MEVSVVWLTCILVNEQVITLCYHMKYTCSFPNAYSGLTVQEDYAL